jgi:2-acylglycerol O-acyltransferase 2
MFSLHQPDDLLHYPLSMLAQVPVFVFGQSATYSWWRPGPAGAVAWLSRRIGAVPLAVWGRWGSCVPHRHPMTVVIGKPIYPPTPPAAPTVPLQQQDGSGGNQVATKQPPSPEQVDALLKVFIREMEALVQRHKASAGCPDMQLRVL